MTDRVHLEGMGLTGCLLAHQLAANGVDFTWNDIDAPQTAWRASTGAIYPCGRPGSIDFEAYRRWHLWAKRGLLTEHFEEASYIFNHKQPPHHGQYDMAPLNDCMQMAMGLPSYHLNAQTFVPFTRDLFVGQRYQSYDKLSGRRQLIRSHGFGERRSHSYWGWTRLVKLELADRPGQDPLFLGRRPAFYFREGRFIMAYAYPVPGTPYWYSGSSIIKQKLGKEHDLSVNDKFDRWHRNFERLSGGAVRVVGLGPTLTGWRPSRSKEDREWTTMGGDGVIRVPPLWNSGIRHFPMVWGTLAPLLGIQGQELAVTDLGGQN